MEKVLQFGEGNFLRGFVDYMFDKLQKSGLFEGQVVVVQPIEKGGAALLNQQKGKYNLVLRALKDGQPVQEHHAIGIISRAINPYADFQDCLLHQPDSKPDDAFYSPLSKNG